MNRHLARSSTTSARYSPIRIETRPNRGHLHLQRFLDKSLHRVLTRWPRIPPRTQTMPAMAGEPHRPDRRVRPRTTGNVHPGTPPGRARSTSAGSGPLPGRAGGRRPDPDPPRWGRARDFGNTEARRGRDHRRFDGDPAPHQTPRAPTASSTGSPGAASSRARSPSHRHRNARMPGRASSRTSRGDVA
jgi:hypothetical protein